MLAPFHYPSDLSNSFSYCQRKVNIHRGNRKKSSQTWDPCKLQSTLLASPFLSLSSTVTAGSADTYHLQDTYVGSRFLSGFNWKTFNDPSGGNVNCLDQGTALQRNLTYGKNKSSIFFSSSLFSFT